MFTAIGSLEDNFRTRANYRDALVAYLFNQNGQEQFTDKLDEDSKRRMYTNPLRVLDSKNPDVQALLNQTRRRSARGNELIFFTAGRRFFYSCYIKEHGNGLPPDGKR
ncbi:hypothetical protein [Klebsiella pneumoniae]|uniref:hypothetical protein n=1 Tax=Klebsiella pneumoniae TaxID=573 RepID=UPI00398881AB